MPGPDLSAFTADQFNPHDPGYSADPYPYYAWFREHAPMAWVGPPYDAWWVFRHRDVQALVQDDAVWSKQNPTKAPGMRVLNNLPTGIFTSDNPAHDKVRGELHPLFDRAIDGSGQVAREVGQALLASAARGGGRLELIASYALPLPIEVLRRVLGIDAMDWPLVTQWVGAFAAANDPTVPFSMQMAGGTAAAALTAFYTALFHGGPSAPAPGSLCAAMQAARSRVLNAEVATANAVTLSIAGYLSTTFLIGTGTLNLLRSDSADKLRRNPGLMDSAVWEMLRYDAPFQLVDRWAKADMELHGRFIAEGQRVTGVVGSANRDPAAFADPDVFDIERFMRPAARGKVLSFGDGIHRCLGEPLLKQTAPAAFGALLDTLPALSLGGTPQWQTDPVLRAVSNLPLVLG